MFDYDSYFNLLQSKNIDPDLDYPILVRFLAFEQTCVEYTSGTVICFDSEAFYENSQFIISRNLLSAVKFKELFDF